jgi:hypothetical protein
VQTSLRKKEGTFTT